VVAHSRQFVLHVVAQVVQLLHELRHLVFEPLEPRWADSFAPRKGWGRLLDRQMLVVERQIAESDLN